MLRGFVILSIITGVAMGQAMVQHAAAAAGGAAAAAGSKKVADGLEKLLGSAAAGAATAAATPAVAPVVPVPAPATGKRGKPSPYEAQVNRAGGTEMAPVYTPGAHTSIPSPEDVEPTPTVSGEAVPGNSWVSRRPQSQQALVPAFVPFVTIEAPVASRGLRRNNGTPPMPELAAIIQMSVPALPILPIPVLPPPPPPILATPEMLAGIHEGATIESVVEILGTPASKIAMYDDGKLIETLRIEAKGSRIGTIRLINGLVIAVEPASN
jgi:hypothetical protein